MMWLGIVLHVSLNHLVAESPAPWRDPQTTLIADFLIAFIHAFRMPVFFVLAGFFVALLIGHRGYLGMLKHRLRRVALPFAIFWPIIFPLTVVLLGVFVHQMVRGTLGLDPNLIPKPPGDSLFSTIHLWFLYLLMWFCVFTSATAWLSQYLPAKLTAFCSEALNLFALRWWGVIILALPLALVGAPYRAGVVIASGSFAPPIAEWVNSGVFFAMGLALYQRRLTTLNIFGQRCSGYGLAGLASFLAWLVIFETNRTNPALFPHSQFLMAFAYGLTSWLWSFALIGGAVRYLAKRRAWLQYLADSSYWAYLIHMLGTIGFGALLCNLPFNALSKMVINMTLTTALCLITFQWLVRGRFIGRLLNGKSS
jgi:fucose 4-O-acetylase-like acetyltransferase